MFSPRLMWPEREHKTDAQSCYKVQFVVCYLQGINYGSYLLSPPCKTRKRGGEGGGGGGGGGGREDLTEMGRVIYEPFTLFSKFI